MANDTEEASDTTAVERHVTIDGISEDDTEIHNFNDGYIIDSNEELSGASFENLLLFYHDLYWKALSSRLC